MLSSHRTAIVAGSPGDERMAPAFLPEEKAAIAAWSASYRPRGVRTAINTGHAFLAEALHVVPASPEDAWWLVHKTPDGAVALRMWPGVAEIVPTLAEALAIIGKVIDPWSQPEAGPCPSAQTPAPGKP